MEIVTSLPTGARGGTKKHVEEWSRLDQLTGMLEHARVEADHWSSNTSNSRHHYGKIVDSRARNLADGSVQQQQQMKQLEVFQAHIPGGSVQVIRSQTSTSSSWHNSKPILRGKSHLDWPPSLNGSLIPAQTRLNKMEAELDDFKLHENLVNLNVEKTKANVARLLPSRRPPTRSKPVKTRDEDDDDENNVHRRPYVENGVESICPIIETKKFENENLAANFAALTSPQQAAAAAAAVAASEHHSLSAVIGPTRIHETLTKKKSISDENLASMDDENANSDSWKRDSRSRWSFQYPRSKFKDSTGVDNGFPEAKSELESVLQRVLRSKGECLAKNVRQNHVSVEQVTIRPKIIEPTVYPKRKSFVTEESLKETKQRLRHLNGFNGFESQSEISNNSSSSIGGSSGVEPDDGICTDSRGESDKDDNECSSASCVTNNLTNSFINSGISSSAIDTSSYKSDEWYDRRKSYGFEPVSNFSSKKTIFSDVKPAPNLSTDSGICRSSELELASTSMIRRLTAEVKSNQDESQIQKTKTPELVRKSADVFELLRKYEKRVADEASTAAKPTVGCDSWKIASDSTERTHANCVDLWQRPKTPKDNDLVAPARATSDSWIRTSKTPPDAVELDTSTSLKSSVASATSWSTTTSKARSSDLVETPPVTRGRVLEALESLRQSSNGNAFEPHSQRFRRSNELQETDDLALKRHSIACDDSKYVMSKFADTGATSRFCDKLSSPQTSDQPKTTIINVNGGEAIPLVAAGETAPPTADVKKPKKVEFSKTEVHFAAAEPGKIKIVETDEKPPPVNLYRRSKRRSVSASPKMLGVASGYTKFGDHEEHKEVGDSHESKSRTGRRSSFNAPNANHTPRTWPEDDSSSAALPKKQDNFPKAFGSTTCDNGLAVTISSMRPGLSDVRRASWSIIDGNECKTTPAGYSTKINFGKEGVTVIADTKSRRQSAENVPPKTGDASREDENFREKLIVRIGECGGGSANAAAAAACAAVGGAKKSVLQENRFSNGFRNSIYCHRLNDRLKSTSLIIDTLRKGRLVDRGGGEKVAEPGETPLSAKASAKVPLEQPSTYIMEMNELQQRYSRARQHRSVDRGQEELAADAVGGASCKLRSRGIYNTVPLSKNVHQRAKLPNSDLLLEKALNVFDRLYNASRGDCAASHEKSSCKAFVEPAKRKEQIKKAFQQHRERRASQTCSTPPSPVVHPLISFRHDGNISDDSLRADEEVQSYMSTAALDEYENELAGSWSRRKYLKLVNSHKTIKEDEEILEKSHFKPLRIEEEKIKTVTNSTNVDIKRPKITSVAVNVLRDVRPEDTIAAAKKFTTVLLNSNDTKKAESTSVPVITGAHDSNYLSPRQDLLRSSKHKSATGEEHIIPLRLADDHHCRRSYAEHSEDRHVHRSCDTSTSRASSSRAKNDYKPVTIIHHGVRLQDKEPADNRHLAHFPPSSSSPKKEFVGTKARSRKSVPLPKEPQEACHVAGIGGGSLRKKTTTSTAGRERLFDSGRDSWLNVPKERRTATSGSTVERKEPIKSSRTSQKVRTGYATSSDIDKRHTSGSYHRTSKLPTASSARKSRLVDVNNVEADATDIDRDADATAGITSATYTDASSEEDTSSRRPAYRKQFSKPLTTISEKSGLRLANREGSRETTYAKIKNTTTAGLTPSTKPSVTRTTSNSSLESRSNSYEFKYPVLKTEERSKRRAARMLQRATSREALMKAGHISSSEDITSDNDKCDTRSANKPKPTRKVKPARTIKPAEPTSQQSTRISAPSRSKANRLIQQATATMEINIFNIKSKPDDRKRYTYGSIKDQCSRGKKELDATSHNKCSNLYGYSVTKHKTTKDGSIPSRVNRPVH